MDEVKKQNIGLGYQLKTSWNECQHGLYKKMDWMLVILVLGLSFMGVASIFAATATATEEEVTGLANLLNTHSTLYAGKQLMFAAAGFVIMFIVALPDYHIYGDNSQIIYVVTVAVLAVLLLVAKAGRGSMKAYISSGSGQLSEFGKVSMIIALANMFARRKHPIRNLVELMPSVIYIAIPTVLVFLQPDFGTGIVYLVIYAILVFVSGTNPRLIWGVIVAAVLVLTVALLYLTTASDSFRMTRIYMWLNPEQYPDDARQVINGQIALGSGGLFGKGITSVGSFASLGYIPDDHTDFCFAILCEAFGLVGALCVVTAFAIMLFRMLHIARTAMDKLGEYMVMGVTAMFLFHVIENICMILGITPVTGIPLPFISYGGSNCLTNWIAIGLVMNVVMRSKQKLPSGHDRYTRQL